MPDGLAYASPSDVRPLRWAVRRYWMWVVADAGLRVAAELVAQQVAKRDTWSDLVSGRLTAASVGMAVGLVVLGSVALGRSRSTRRWGRVWCAWAGSVVLAIPVFLNPWGLLTPILYH